MPLWGRKKSEAESGRQHGAEARSIPGWLATNPFSGVAGLLNRWAAPVLWEALDEKVTPLLVEDAVESVKLRGKKLELKAAGYVGWLFLSALRTVYRNTLTQDAEIRKLRDEVAALQERHLHMKETIESAVTRGDQMEARWNALAVRVAKQKSRHKPKMPSTVQVRALVRKPKSRQKPKIPSTVQVRALVRKQKSRQKPKIPSTVQVRALVCKENWDPHTWEDEVEVRVTELGGVESGEGRVGEIEGEKGVNGGQIQNSRSVRDYTQIELLERTRMFSQMPAEPLFKWLVRSWDSGAKDALQKPFTLGPITEGDPFELEIIVQDDVDDVVMWSLWQRLGKKRMPQDWALVEIERITDDRPVTLKTWVPLLGQEQAARIFCRPKREDPELHGGDGEDDRNKEPRSVTGEEQDDLTTEEGSDCDGLLLRQAAPSHRENTSSTSSDPEEHISATNPVSLPGVKGQEQAALLFGRLKREDPELDGGDGEDDRSKEPRSVTGEEQDDLTTEEYPEDLHAGFEAWEAPCACPGHA
ncbi:hypothetical protein NDU88_001034 [Pleurodeles waltl]|uniref:Uncharacterized protein n=1 Tax=Pleurodeles waltl TaxID=8319 RepID=A0AAV7TGN2_PLEWA|nr:hypothetical protein NDU88_001034 [Pleurodeles waltl]